ncbi:hypothetical protein RQM65_08155 [Pricia sp. S334]|uniref:tRNA_anti-like n=1 Tax=Pricia mediterranea TaxID=3076079 RepID=A0ABU3L4G5_9FLAO|nr:hypothetical protein [Pricia sp. S334]MDT7828634.1 hypothetical protein [Pricia sp. S334]
MKKITTRYGIGVLLAGVAGLFVWWYVDRPDDYGYSNDRPFLSISIDSIGNYFKPNTEIGPLEPEHLVEIEGRIKEINAHNHRNTILLKGSEDASPYAICDMQTGQEKELEQLRENDTVKVKGVFKGYLKDAVFLHCKITHYNLHE